MRCLLLRAGAMLLAGLCASPASASALHVEKTGFVLDRDDGRSLDSMGLVGAELALGNGATLRIDGVRTDPADPELLWHTFSVQGADGTWRNPCGQDADGRQEGLPLPGRWRADGRFEAGPSHFALTCANGAQAKCLRFGYKPWAVSADGRSLHPLYEACVRMVRADYCGDGRPSTASGTRIDIYDDHGVLTPQNDPDDRFEAGWSPAGAVCVAHTRVPANLTMEALAERCPRLAATQGEACTEASARVAGAVLFNRSR